MTPPFPPPAAVVHRVTGSGRLWLATHEHPDPDGVGSLLGLGLALRAAGRDAVMLRHESTAERFALLPGYEQTVTVAEAPGPPEAVVLLDCHEIGRLGAIAGFLPPDVPVAVIDHHVAGPEDRAPETWIETSAPSTTCLVHSLLLTIEGLHVTPQVADCLYAGLLTDTGGFRFSNTSAQALSVAADLVSHGADAAGLAEELLHRQSPGSLQLLSRMLATVRFLEGGRVAFMDLPRRLLSETGADADEAEGFVNFATAVRDVAMVALFREEEPLTWRLSLRANGSHDVQSVASRFGGGGHRKAAGCTLTGELDEVKQRVLTAMQLQLGTVEA